MRPTLFTRFLGALLCLAATPSHAAVEYKIKQIIFDGTTPWSQSDLEAATGLKPGDPLTSDSLKAAANKLSATGDFDDIQASLNGPVNAINVVFKIVAGDPARRYPVVLFANFPWWSSSELTSLVHQKVPLFNGTLPEAGDQQDAVTAALQEILQTKQLTAKIANEIFEPGVGHPRRTISYRITSPSVRFSTVDITGASPAMAPELAKSTAFVKGRPYNEMILGQILNLWANAGYLDAKLTDIHREVVSTGDPLQVHVTASIEEGSPYHVSALTFAGTSVVSSAQFAAAAKLHPGDIAARPALRDSIAVLDTAYRRLGYMDVAIDTQTKLDPTTHQAAYTLTVTPGNQYRIGTVNVLNLPPQQRKDFDSAWKLTPGTLFDLTYAQDFIKNNSALRSLAEYNAAFKTEADPDTHLVNITMTFHRRGDSVQVNAQ